MGENLCNFTVKEKSSIFAEKFRNEKFRNMKNPFKFGTIVEGEFFTDRVQEVAYIKQFIESENHLVLISPRRFGKSSVVKKALAETYRQNITLNLQNVTSAADLAAKLLREIYKIHPFERVRQFVMRFRVIPTLTTNPITGMIDLSFQPTENPSVLLEDVMDLMDGISSPENRLVVVLDEFQEIIALAPNLDKQLRAMMQAQKNINYILLGSQETMMTDIFEKKKSPFYHFGQLMRLKAIPRADFEDYISSRLRDFLLVNTEIIVNQILDFTHCHPYYTQQLAAQIWQMCALQTATDEILESAIEQIIEIHDLDYERLWVNFNKTDKSVLIKLAKNLPLQSYERKTSTTYSALKRLQKSGFLIYTTKFEIEDPFFSRWIFRATN